MSAPRILDSGEAALVVEFGDRVAPEVNARVRALDAALAAAALPGVRELVPTYRSLMIHYDPLALPRAELAAVVRRLDVEDAAVAPPGRLWRMPCCYDEPFAEDIEALAAAAGVSARRAADLHMAGDYRVYMYGFAPGFCYLGGLPAGLAVSRRASPRPPHAAGAVLVGGGLSLITTFAMPTGWWVIGRTPERLFAPARDPAFLVGIGDAVRFEAVDRATFDALAARAEAGEIVARRERP